MRWIILIMLFSPLCCLLLQAPVAHGQQTGESLLAVPFLSQVPPGAWAKTNNCGPASLVMAAQYALGGTPTPDHIRQVDAYLGLDENGGSGTTTAQLVRAGNALFGLNLRSNHWTIEHMREECGRGNPVIVAVNSASLTNRRYRYACGHFLVVIGFQGSDVICNDPGTARPDPADTTRYSSRYTLEDFTRAIATYNGAVVVGFEPRHAPAPSAMQRMPVTTLFVIDCSGSMDARTPQGTRKLAAAQEAARRCLNAIDFDMQDPLADHQVGLIAFSDVAIPVLPLTSTIADVRRTLDDLSPQASTNFGDPLDLALEWMEALHDDRSQGKKVIIFLSDGMTNAGSVSRDDFLVDTASAFPHSSRLYQRARDAQVAIYTVGFGDPAKIYAMDSGEGLDIEVLERLAQVPGTGGAFAYAYEVFALDNIFVRIFHDATGDIVFEHTGAIAQGERLQIGPINPRRPAGAHVARRFTLPWLITPAHAADNGRSRLLVTLDWAEGDVCLTLTDPRGRVVDAAYPGAQLRTDMQPICIAIDAPAQGNWMAEVGGVRIPTDASPFQLIASARLPAAGGGGMVDNSAEQLALAALTGGILVLFTLCVLAVRKRLSVVAPPLAAWLQVYEPGVPPRNVPVTRLPFRIGRGGDNTLVLRDPTVASCHAEVILTPHGVAVRDLDGGGTLRVNERPVASAALRQGDRIRLGRTSLIFYPPR